MKLENGLGQAQTGELNAEIEPPMPTTSIPHYLMKVVPPVSTRQNLLP